MKKVEVKIMKIDPNLIFGLLEDSANEDREERVAGKILQTKKESSPVPRQRKAATPKPARAAAPKTSKTPKTEVEVKTAGGSLRKSSSISN